MYKIFKKSIKVPFFKEEKQKKNESIHNYMQL